MKGEALITVKDKDGNIKKQVKESNMVFDVPKEIVKQILQNIDLGEINTTTTNQGATYISTYIGNPISFAMSYDTWFRSIFINDENTSEVDYKDWKMPVLYGGEYNPANTSNKRYSMIDTASSSRSTNKIKKVYIWTNCPAFNLKSINLRHLHNGMYYNSAYIPLNNDPSYFKNFLRKYGNYYWKAGQMAQETLLGSLSGNTLYTKSDFHWYVNGGRRTFNGTAISYNTLSNSYWDNNSVIIPMKNYEMCLLSNLQYTDSILSSTSNYIKYINIINANTGEIKRSIPLTQFEGFVGYSSANPYQTISNIKIISTDFGTYLVTRKTTNSPYSFYLWRIPEQEEYEQDYSNNEVIPLYVTNPIFTTSQSFIQHIECLNEYIFDQYTSTTVRIKDVSGIVDPTDADKITTYNYLPINRTASVSSSTYQQAGAVVNKFYDMTTWTTNWETWYNTTALNLAEPVAIAEGDTLTVEYTITAS